MRSAIGMVWSCHGASPSSPSPAAPCMTAAPCSGRQRRRSHRDSNPAKKPFSQERCASENGALDGNDLDLRRRRDLVHEDTSRVGQLAQRLAVMAARKRQESFFRRSAVREIGLQQSLDRLRRVLGLEVVIDLLPDIGIRTKAAAGEEMIALDRIVILADRHLRRDQADIADVMLRAGMMAAGEMDVERRVDVDARLAPVADLGGMALGVRTPRTCSRHCRCRRSARRGFARPRPQARSSRSRRSPARHSRRARPEISRFCQTVRRISPSPRSCAILASPRI